MPAHDDYAPPYCKRVDLSGPHRRVVVAEHPGRVYLALHGPLCTMGMSLSVAEAKQALAGLGEAILTVEAQDARPGGPGPSEPRP